MSEKKAKKIDQALLLDEKDGEARIVRLRQNEKGQRSVEVGRVKKTESMTPEELKDREIINVKKRKNSPFHDVEVIQEGTGHAGPARVTSQAYRDGWDRIFGDDDEIPENVTWH